VKIALFLTGNQGMLRGKVQIVVESPPNMIKKRKGLRNPHGVPGVALKRRA
jgi:hypothetical protein